MTNMTKNLVSIIAAAVILAVLAFSGVLQNNAFTHPAWHNNGVMFGSLIGAVVAAVIFWLESRNPVSGRNLKLLAGLVFVVCLIAVKTYSGIFINSANYEPMAADMWHKTSYGVIATFVIVSSFVVRKLMR